MICIVDEDKERERLFKSAIDNKDTIEFITNPDGTISMLIKNIGKIESR